MEIFKLYLVCFLASSGGASLSPNMPGLSPSWEYFEAFEVEGLCSGEQTCSPVDCTYEGPMRPNLFYGSHASCDCHFHCLYLGTCCLNFEEVCLAGYSKEWFQLTYPNQEAIPQLAKLAEGGIKTKSKEQIDTFMQLRQKVVTVELVSFYETNSEFPLVTRCPDCGYDGQCNELKKKCESSVTTEWAQLIYVSHGGVIFKNKFCADCYSASSPVAEPLGAGIFCEEEILESDPFVLFDEGDYSGILNMINDGQCLVQHNGNELEPFVLPEIVSQCDDQLDTGVQDDEDYKRLSDACSSYVAYVEESSFVIDEGFNAKTYKNKHCAICNGASVLFLMDDVCYCSIFSPKPSCIPMTMIPVEYFPIVPFFSIALDFAEHAKLERVSSKLCNRESQDIHLPSGECIDRYCPQDAIKVNAQCAMADNIEIHHEIGGISLGVELGLPKSLTFQQTQTTMTAFKRDFLHSLGESEASIDLKMATNMPQKTLGLVANEVRTNLNLLVFRLTYDCEVIMKEIIEAMNLNYMMVTINHFAVCPQGFQDKVLSEFTFVWLNEERMDLRVFYSGIASSSAMLFPEFEVKLDPHHHKLTINISQQGESWEAVLNLHFCYKIDSECLDACDTLGSSCRNCTLEPLRKFENPKRESADQDKSQWSDWEMISTFVLAILSILALVSCLIMHRLFPDLMKKGGRAFTQLLISLLGAEVGLLIGSFQVWGDVSCSVLAALQHYAWLASFFWNTVMSWDVFCIFVLQTSGDESSQALYLQMLFGWVPPIFIVGTCGVLHTVDLFKYGGNGACWISGSLQLGLSFGLPVGIIIVINLVFYALIIRQLFRDMDSAQAVGRPYDPKARFLLCCKLSTIVGFTWVFGFLANIPGLGFFKHVFSVCAGLNGTMVALAFTISSRTIQVIRSQFTALRTATPDS